MDMLHNQTKTAKDGVVFSHQQSANGIPTSRGATGTSSWGFQGGIRGNSWDFRETPPSQDSSHMLGWAVDPKITLLRVIPTMTFQNHHDRFYVSLISCQARVARRISSLLKCLWLLSTSQINCRTSSDILSGIPSGISPGIFWHSFWHIFWYFFWHCF